MSDLNKKLCICPYLKKNLDDALKQKVRNMPSEIERQFLSVFSFAMFCSRPCPARRYEKTHTILNHDTNEILNDGRLDQKIRLFVSQRDF